ncbi:Dyp-type peroxidase [Herbiconiux sp. CPCC 205763]|uniref:Dyp-type peroxidase n=1 Tax=Herbiconiux aconitum TaxID=2970913 RepID=A0ABT2GPP7_9MICO|nr:Dyp-type peroxidase [Herbiconiux aconitum]MCS5717270.1 Dyp-type peroxidase [Herbiconiux aconitum]
MPNDVSKADIPGPDTARTAPEGTKRGRFGRRSSERSLQEGVAAGSSSRNEGESARRAADEQGAARGGVGRRGFLTGLLGAGVGAGVAAAGAIAVAPAAPVWAVPHPGAPGHAPGTEAAPPTGAATAAAPSASFPFEGPTQQGILTPPQAAAAFAAFDVTAADRGELEALLRTLTERARFLTTGGAPAPVGITAPPADSGVLGPVIDPDGLTITVSLGASLFGGGSGTNGNGGSSSSANGSAGGTSTTPTAPDRFGLAAQKPRALRTMEDFPNDDLDRSQCDGDLLLQICANNRDTVTHALRDLMRTTRGGMQLRWRTEGFVSPPRPSGTPRNLMGFKDGTANPDPSDPDEMAALVWAATDGSEPAWTAGGTYHVVRRIRMLVEFWDRVNLREQEGMIGRSRDVGAPLTGKHEFDEPDFSSDPAADSIQMGAHIRLANPRTPESTGSRMFRRGYNYDAGLDVNGNLDMGLVFTTFNQDLERQFVTVQKRLADEALSDYISPFGGGYFFALPGVQGADDWFGSGLLA